jgi:hypothetical protein
MIASEDSLVGLSAVQRKQASALSIFHKGPYLRGLNNLSIKKKKISDKQKS